MKLDYKIEILPVRVSSMISEGLLHMGVSTVETRNELNIRILFLL